MTYQERTTDKADLGHLALARTEVLATKIGGENAMEFQTNLARAKDRKTAGKAQIIVVSALRTPRGSPDPFNTTDELLKLKDALRAKNKNSVQALLEGIRSFHVKAIREKVDDEAQEKLLSVLDQELSRFTTCIEPLQEGNDEELSKLQGLGEDWVYSSQGFHQSITGFGEELCRALYAAYFQHHGLQTNDLQKNALTELVYGDDPAEALRNRAQRETLRKSYAHQIRTTLTDDSSAIILEGGHAPLLGTLRGYTEATTAEAARAADQGEELVLNVEKKTTIQTGNGVKGATRVEVMSPALMTEFIGARGADAGVVQSQVPGIIHGTHISIVVHDPDRPEMGSTYIPWNAGPEVDVQEIVQPKKAKTVLEISGDMAEKKGVLALITHFLKDSNIDQTFSTRNTVTLTLDQDVSEAKKAALELALSEKFGSEFKALKKPAMGMIFALGGINREKRRSEQGKIQMENRIAQPPFAAQLIEGGEEGEALPYALTIDGPMSDSPGVLAVITDVLQDYNIDQTFSTETTWTVTLDRPLSAANSARLYDALRENFGNGWNLTDRRDLRLMTKTEDFTDHPVWTLLNERGISVHYMHAIPERGVTVLMVPQDRMKESEQILHDFYYAA